MPPVAPDTETSGAFVRALSDELALIDQFVVVLKREQTALSDGNIDELPEHAEQKTRLAVSLNALAEQRNNALEAQGLNKDRAGISAWCAAHPEAAAAAAHWARILTLAGEARELNRVNGDLIQMRLQYNTKALEALQGGRDSLDLYGPDGQARTQGSQRIDDSV